MKKEIIMMKKDIKLNKILLILCLLIGSNVYASSVKELPIDSIKKLNLIDVEIKRNRYVNLYITNKLEEDTLTVQTWFYFDKKSILSYAMLCEYDETEKDSCSTIRYHYEVPGKYIKLREERFVYILPGETLELSMPVPLLEAVDKYIFFKIQFFCIIKGVNHSFVIPKKTNTIYLESNQSKSQTKIDSLIKQPHKQLTGSNVYASSVKGLPVNSIEKLNLMDVKIKKTIRHSDKRVTLFITNNLKKDTLRVQTWFDFEEIEAPPNIFLYGYEEDSLVFSGIPHPEEYTMKLTEEPVVDILPGKTLKLTMPISFAGKESIFFDIDFICLIKGVNHVFTIPKETNTIYLEEYPSERFQQAKIDSFDLLIKQVRERMREKERKQLRKQLRRIKASSYGCHSLLKTKTNCLIKRLHIKADTVYLYSIVFNCSNLVWYHKNGFIRGFWVKPYTTKRYKLEAKNIAVNYSIEEYFEVNFSKGIPCFELIFLEGELIKLYIKGRDYMFSSIDTECLRNTKYEPNSFPYKLQYDLSKLHRMPKGFDFEEMYSE